MIVTRVTTTVTPQLVDEDFVDSAAVQVETGSGVYLTGTDGSVWDLNNGPVRLQPGVTGFMPPDVEHRWSTSPMLPGAIRAGYGIGVLELTLPVFLVGGSALGWRDLDAELWRALDPESQCYLTVVSPDATSRVLPVWFTGVGGAELPRDPFLMRHQAYALQFVAADPFWQGPTVSQLFKPATPVAYYAPSGSAFVKTLMPSNSTASSTLRNDGDIPAWPVVSVSGSVASFAVTVDGGTVSYGAVSNGQTVWIDYHPTRQTVGFARDDNSETAWLGVTARDFRPVPPGGEVPFGITLTTPGVNASLSVDLTARYRRPW